ncbi:hypothetical protein [Metabacillus halosaccharovorans]|uniref:hypothetical protein n=1 Tax=Metabacillus halosaccharovorans TaxID=930124 RepID=UPI000C7F94ED|nr:hypothetical protein [Metabacillus halosaccharovorans]MCM3444185.1 hypothetical protein [Metabacillus halosaccharovorans]PMC36400.1 hypothetical protein CJ195_16565 [Bacillus sp. UMB0899]
MIFDLDLQQSSAIVKEAPFSYLTKGQPEIFSILANLIIRRVLEYRSVVAAAAIFYCTKGQFSSKLSVAENFIPFLTKKPNAIAMGFFLWYTRVCQVTQSM